MFETVADRRSLTLPHGVHAPADAGDLAIPTDKTVGTDVQLKGIAVNQSIYCCYMAARRLDYTVRQMKTHYHHHHHQQMHGATL